MQPGLSEAHFFSIGKSSGKKIAGTEDGLSCPNK